MAPYWWTNPSLLLCWPVTFVKTSAAFTVSQEKEVGDRRKLLTACLASHIGAEDMHTERVLTLLSGQQACVTYTPQLFHPSWGVFKSADQAHKMTKGTLPKQTPLKHTRSHKVSQMTTPLESETAGVCIHLRSAVSRSFTAEAADNTLPAAAEEPGEGERPQDRTREACWSCDRSTCPWPRLPGVGNELQQLGSCTACSYHCCEENKHVMLCTNSK